MRVTTDQNVFNERHGKPLRTYEWIAPAGTSPADVLTKAETALGLKLQQTAGEQHGFVCTRDEGADGVYVAVVLYEACADAACPAGHKSVVHRKAADPSLAARTAMKATIGEHANRRLT